MFFSSLFKSILNISLVSTISLWLVACGGGATGNVNNFLIIDDQSLVDLSEIQINNLKVEEVVCVVIYETSNDGNTLGDSIGEKTFEIGDHQDVSVRLQREIQNDETLLAELRQGACGNSEASLIALEGSSSDIEFVVSYSTIPHVATSDKIIANVLQIHVDKVIAEQSSWLVVHRFDDNQENNLGELLGYQLVQEGHNSDVVVALNQALEDQDELIVALYLNADVIESEDFSVDDTLISNAISKKFSIEVSATSGISVCKGCIRFNITNIGFLAYEWNGDAAARSKINVIENNTGNETITLVVGERYEITNPEFRTHPFELVTEGRSEILLSQNSHGTFEDDSVVNWVDSNGVLAFTLTDTLAQQLDSYLCAVHPIMGGDFEISP